MGDKRKLTHQLAPGNNTRKRNQREFEPKPKGDEAQLPHPPDWLNPAERQAYRDIAELAGTDAARGDALIVEYAAYLLVRNRACAWSNDKLAKQFNRVLRTKIAPLKWTMK